MELRHLKKQELKKLRQQVLRELQKRYVDHRPPKYGNLNKTFNNEQELQTFFDNVTSDTARLLFQLQAYLGLRIMEACNIRMTDLDLHQRTLWVRSIKDSIPSSMYLHDRIYTALIDYLKDNHVTNQEYLFPSWAAQHHSNTTWPHVSPNWARNQFTIAIQRSQLQSVYAETEEDYGRKPRSLHKLSTHSLRRWFIQNVHSITQDLMITQKLARHRDVKNTLIYLHADQEKLNNVLEIAFNNIHGETIKTLPLLRNK